MTLFIYLSVFLFLLSVFIIIQSIYVLLDKIFFTEWFIKQHELEEKLILEQIDKQNDEENKKWIEAEKIGIAQWTKLQEEKEKLKQKRLEQEAKINLVSLGYYVLFKISVNSRSCLGFAVCC